MGQYPVLLRSTMTAGVRAACKMYIIHDVSFVVADAAVDTYLGQAHVAYSGSQAEKLEKIGTQLWISKFLNWWDAWSDWRRTGYPTLVPVNYPGNLTDGQIPRKLKLPSSEQTRNAGEYGGWCDQS